MKRFTGLLFAGLAAVALVTPSYAATPLNAIISADDPLMVKHPHRISYHDAMVAMGEYEQPITYAYRDAMVLPDGFEYSLPDRYSNIPLHGSIWLSSEYQQSVINTLIH